MQLLVVCDQYNALKCSMTSSFTRFVCIVIGDMCEMVMGSIITLFYIINLTCGDCFRNG